MRMLMIIDPDGIASLSIVVCVWTSLYRRENPSDLCFAGVLIHFRSGKFQALDMSYFSKCHAGFFCEFKYDLC